jgi:two-component system response regulator
MVWSEPVEILLVEDSRTDAEMTIRALNKHGLGKRLNWVKDGAEALDFLFRQGVYAGRAAGDPKLVFLDLKMPMVDGIEVLRKLKHDPRTACIPIVMLTSSAEESDIALCYQLGLNSYMVKPVEFERFVEQVAHAGYYWLIINRVPAAG